MVIHQAHVVPTDAIEACAREAADALARLFQGTRLELEHVEKLSASAVAALHAPRAVVVSFSVAAPHHGAFALIMSEAAAVRLAEHLVGRDEAELSTRQLDALKEVGNIGVSAYLNGLARRIRHSWLPSVPMLVHGAAAAAVESAFAGRGDLHVARLSLEPPRVELSLVVGS